MRKIRIFPIVNNVFLVAIALTMFLPFWHVLMYSFSPGADSATVKFLFWIDGFGLDGYKSVMQTDNILRAYLNTIIITNTGTFASVLCTAMAAYSLSKKNFVWRRFFTVFIFITMIFGGGLIPTYYVVRGLGLVDTLASMIIPRLVNAYYIILMRNFFISLPASLEESAKIDGANDITVFFRLVVPISKPLIATMVLFHAVEYWNIWFDGLIYVNNRNLYPLQLVLRNILYQQDQIFAPGMMPAMAEVVKMACIIVSTAPILFAYPFLQKYFVKGIMIGAVKS